MLPLPENNTLLVGLGKLVFERVPCGFGEAVRVVPALFSRTLVVGPIILPTKPLR